MSSDKFNNSEFFDENFLIPLKKNAQEALDTVNLLIDGLRQASSAAGVKLNSITPDSLENLKQTNEALQEVEASDRGLQEAMKTREKLTKKLTDLDSYQAVEIQKVKEQISQQNKVNKEAARDQLGLTSAYQKASKALNDLRNKYKDLQLAGKANTAEGKEMLKSITAQDQKLKQLDATVGQHHRNVGNYTGAIMKLQKGLGGLTGLVATVAAAFGIDTEAMQRLADVSHELIKTSRELHHATELGEVSEKAHGEAVAETTAEMEAQGAATTELAGAEQVQVATTEEATVAQEELNVAMEANPIGWIIAAIIALGAALYGLNAWMTKSSDATKQLEEDNKKLHATLDESIRVTNNKVTVMEAELNLLKAQKAPLEAIRKKTKEVNDEKMKAIDQNILLIQSDIRVNESKLADIKANNSLIESIYKAAAATAKFMGQTAMADLYEKAIVANKMERAEEITKAIDDEQKQLAEAQADKLNLQTEAIQADEEITNEEIANAKKRSDEKMKALKAYWAEENRLQKERDDDKLAEEQRLQDELDAILAAAQARRDERDAKFSTLKSKLDEETSGGRLRILKEQHDEETKLVEEEYAAGNISALQHYLYLQQLDADYNAAVKSEAEKTAAHEKELRDKKIDEVVDAEQKINDGIMDGLNRRYSAQEKQLQRESSLIDSQIQVQSDLFARGLQNNLAFEEKEKAKNLEKQAQLDAKKRKQEEAQQLASVFLELLKGYAKDGNIDAPAKALAETLVAKGISDAIAGSAYEGTDDTGGAGSLDDKGGRLWMVHPHEAIIRRSANESAPGLAGAWNDGKLDEYFRDIYLPQFASTMGAEDGPAGIQTPAEQSLLRMLSGQLNQLDYTVKNKKESEIHWDSMGNLVKNEVEKGIRRITTKVRPF